MFLLRFDSEICKSFLQKLKAVFFKNMGGPLFLKPVFQSKATVLERQNISNGFSKLFFKIYCSSHVKRA